MSIEAMKQALEALEFARLSIDEWSGYASDYFQNKYDLKGDMAEVEQAITALRTAIEQAEKQEPVGEVMNDRGEVDYISYVPTTGTLLYTTPPDKE
jgi:hypothetical protein